MPEITKENLDVIRCMVENGATHRAIAQRLGVTREAVRYRCHQYGWESRFVKRQHRNHDLAFTGQRECNTCQNIFLLSQFDKDSRNQDGYSSQCKKCRVPTIAQWQRDNKDKMLAASRKWKDNNREKVKAYSAQYYQKHRAERKEYLKSWFKRHPHMCKVYKQQREERMKGAPGYFTESQLIARIEFYGDRCYICRGPNEAIDHVKPLNQGGSNWPVNLRPICIECNSRKWSHWPYQACSPR